MPPVEAWEKVYVKDADFLKSVHGQPGCIACHGGVGGQADMAAAHKGVKTQPDEQKVCGPCHSQIVAANAKSLHTTLRGYDTILYARASQATQPKLDEMMSNHCDKCHTSCGQCHVIRPTNLGGGLAAGHQFKKVPPMNLTCTGCHGSRVNDEYKGENEGVPADVHWIKGGMACFQCHSGQQMHGLLGEQKSRYDGAPTPDCRQCHPKVKAGDGIAYHTEPHLSQMACQTCHATTYKNCYGCHTAKSDKGEPFFKLDASELGFKIGLNPIKSEQRPWKYVIVRHVPIAPDVYKYYGENLLPNFDALPTWKYATPHTIQRKTPQTQSCNSCHGNATVFLTEKDVKPELLKANKSVIVSEIPKAK